MSSEKLKKEHLTDELIKKDIISLYQYDAHIPTNILLAGISIFYVFLISLLTPYAWFALFIPALLFLIWYVNRRKRIKEIQSGQFTVVTDTFLYEKGDEVRMEPTFYRGPLISYLQFSSNGRFELEGVYYTWSDTYKMSDSGICNTSLPGDIFYLVLLKRTGKILMAYNTKFFEYGQ